MHICHIITRMIVGGAQENTLLSCIGLQHIGHRVTLISGPTHGPEGSLLSQVRAAPIEFIELPELVRPIQPLRDLQAIHKIVRLLKQLRPDVVHTHSSKAGIVGRIAARLAGVPRIVHTIHGMSFNRTQPAFARQIARASEHFVAPLTDRFITVAEAMIDQSADVRLAPRERFEVVYSGMDVAAFDPAAFHRDEIRSRLGIPPEATVLVTIARLFRNKGYEDLIAALHVARDRLPGNLVCLWIGDGADAVRLEVALREACPKIDLIRTGLIAPDRIPEVLSAADVLTHASRWEGLPRAMVQARLMQCPVVGYALDGAVELIDHACAGTLVPFPATEALADAIVDWCADPLRGQDYRRRARPRVAEQFSAERMVGQLARIYAEL